MHGKVFFKGVKRNDSYVLVLVKGPVQTRGITQDIITIFRALLLRGTYHVFLGIWNWHRKSPGINKSPDVVTCGYPPMPDCNMACWLLKSHAATRVQPILTLTKLNELVNHFSWQDRWATTLGAISISVVDITISFTEPVLTNSVNSDTGLIESSLTESWLETGWLTVNPGRLFQLCSHTKVSLGSYRYMEI